MLKRPRMRKLVAGNWKMNGLRADGVALARDLAGRARAVPPPCEIAICPPATLLIPVGEALAGSVIMLGAQDCHAAEMGAHTGDLSATMLRDAGCRYVILGHSERRADHHETDSDVRAKVAAARQARLVPIVCIGETQDERAAGKTLDIISRQIKGSLPPGLPGADLVVAYEPVWAIGSGSTPTVAEVADVHAHIRRTLSAAARILYGGSVKPANAKELMAVANVDGALVGGASLVAAQFWAIAEACG